MGAHLSYARKYSWRPQVSQSIFIISDGKVRHFFCGTWSRHETHTRQETSLRSCIVYSQTTPIYSVCKSWHRSQKSCIFRFQPHPSKMLWVSQPSHRSLLFSVYLLEGWRRTKMINIIQCLLTVVPVPTNMHASSSLPPHTRFTICLASSLALLVCFPVPDCWVWVFAYMGRSSD
jgi:hypothetical protein